MKFFRNNWVTGVAILVATPIFLGVFFTEFDVLNSGLQALVRVENSEIDEIIATFLIVIFGLVIDRLRAWSRTRRRAEIDEHRLQVLQATMRTVHDLVNNFLNNMQLFRMEGEVAPLSPESLELFDTLIHETAEKLRALGASESVVEYQMASGAGIRPSGPTPAFAISSLARS